MSRKNIVKKSDPKSKKKIVVPSKNLDNTTYLDKVDVGFFEKLGDDLRRKGYSSVQPGLGNKNCRLEFYAGYEQAIEDVGRCLSLPEGCDVEDADLFEFIGLINASFFYVRPKDVIKASKSKGEVANLSFPRSKIQSAAATLKMLKHSKIRNERFNPFWVDLMLNDRENAEERKGM